MFDYHIHSDFSDDAKSPMDDVFAAALAAGLEGIAITDHLDPYYQDDEYPWELDIPGYEAALLAAQEAWGGRIAFAKGIELGLIEGDGLRVCAETVAGFPFDFVIASVHHTARAPIHTGRYLGGRSHEEIAEDYYGALLACLRQYKDYDVLGHLNGIDRYTDGYMPEALYLPYAEEILRQVIADGRGIELNVSTFRYGMKDRGTPTAAILDSYRALGGEVITIGSDAHEARYVGAFIKEGEEILRAHGFRYFTTFMGRQPTFRKL